MWYYNNETGNFAVGSIPMKEITVDEVVTYEEETGWTLIADRPIPHDDYIFDGVNWVVKETPIIVPQVVTIRQARLALLEVGLLQTVDSAIASGTDDAMKIEWEYATEVRRDWQSLIAMTTSLGLTSAQLDELFVLGAAL